MASEIGYLVPVYGALTRVSAATDRGVVSSLVRSLVCFRERRWELAGRAFGVSRR
jgi:hypothetical protein